ncbi:hypothetical protein AURDEDRAFT_167409 [Auricularia subglabra TFB-10046 SS5]|nr:hypothetical protein AURDEDRAFT_167409 [Auricularia subglabra TFB-10046 SS5]
MPSPLTYTVALPQGDPSVPVTFLQVGDSFDYMEWLATNPVVGGVTAATPVGPAPREPESGVCRVGCPPHAYDGCGRRMRDGTPYPTAPARAASAASSHPSLPSLLTVSDSSATDGKAVASKAQEAAREELATRLTALDTAGNGHTRVVFGPHAGRALHSDVVFAVQMRVQREVPRGDYATWGDLVRAQDIPAMLRAAEAFAREVLATEPFYHPEQPAPAVQVVWDFLHDAEIVAEILRVVLRTSEARRLLVPFRRSVASARRCVSSIYEEGLYMDEDAGVLARDIAEPGQQFVHSLTADDLTVPIGNAIQALSAVNGLVQSHAERRKRHY